MQKLELSENAVNIVAENKGLIESLEELAKSGCALASYYCYYYLKFNAEMPRNAEICLKQSLIQGGVLIEKIKQTYLETVTEIKEILVIEKIFYGLDPTGISKEMLKNITKSKSYFPKPDFSYISVIEVVELLIQFININQLMDINQINQENGCTLSHYIFATEDESAILKLLKTKANINIQDVDGNTALHFLFIKNVLEAGKESLNNLSLALIQAIFETNADLTIQNQNNISIINLLIKALTGVKSDEKEYAINIVALMYVIREEKVQTIFNIIEKDPYLKDEFYQKCWMFKINQKNIGSEENNRSFRP